MKRLCAREALKLVPEHGIIGLGGGETIRYLAENIKEAGKAVTVVTPSEQTREICLQLGLTLEETANVSEVEIAFDGWDRLDEDLNAYKSAGGIHTLEKVIARMAKDYVLLADETKAAEKLGYDISIVLEIVPEAYGYVAKKVQAMGGTVKKRNECLLETLFEEKPDLFWLNQELKMITGVIETSLFYHVATKAIVAGTNGIRIIEK